MSPRPIRSTLAPVLPAGPGLVGRQEVARFHRDRDRRRLRAMAAGLLGAAVLVALVVGVVELRVQQVRLSYRLDELRSDKAELEETKSRLRVELAMLTSLARIESKARTELGMVPPAGHQVRLAREFVPGGGGLQAAAPLTASADAPGRADPGTR